MIPLGGYTDKGIGSKSLPRERESDFGGEPIATFTLDGRRVRFQANFLNAKVTLCPPNPKELDKATFTVWARL